MTEVRAKQSFYHDAVGSRAQGATFKVADAATLQMLEQAGYVEKVNAQASAEQMQAQQEAQQRQQEMGQAQAKANENVSKATHDQNMAANQQTQQLAQEAQQRAQQNGADHTNQADQQAMQQQQKQFNPAAVSPKATAKKANENK